MHVAYFSPCIRYAFSVPLNDTGSATQVNYMYAGCTRLTSIPLIDTSSATNFEYMMQGCTALTSIPLFNTSSAVSVLYMCDGCTNVQSGALALYQQMSTQTTPPGSHSYCFTNCGSGTASGQAELAQIPTSWGGTM